MPYKGRDIAPETWKHECQGVIQQVPDSGEER